MARQELNYTFPERLGRHEFAIVPVITPQGNIKHLKIRPDVQPEIWLIMEWGKDGAGRLRQLKSVELTTERVKAGAVFLKDAYEAEGWPEGWAQYERYLKACYTRSAVDKDGKPVVVQLNRSVDHLHFPARLLPKAVAERLATLEQRREATEWKPDESIAHPDEAKALDERARIDAEKKRLRAELDREVEREARREAAQPSERTRPGDAATLLPVATVTKRPEGGVSIAVGPEKKGK